MLIISIFPDDLAGIPVSNYAVRNVFGYNGSSTDKAVFPHLGPERDDHSVIQQGIVPDCHASGKNHSGSNIYVIFNDIVMIYL